MTSEINRCYRALELEPGASLEQVKQAWRELVKVWHPDRFPNDVKLQRKAQERLKEINLAYEQLQEYLTSGTLPPQNHTSRSSSAQTPQWTPPPQSETDAATKTKPSAGRWLLVLPAACVGYAIVMLLTLLASQEPIIGYHDTRTGREIQPVQATLGNIIAAIVFVLLGTKTAPSHKIETSVSLAVLFSMTVAVLFTIGVMRGAEGFYVGWAAFCGMIGIVSAIGASISVYRKEMEERRIAEIRRQRFESQSKTST